MTTPANFFTEKNTASRGQSESTHPIEKSLFSFVEYIFINHSNANQYDRFRLNPTSFTKFSRIKPFHD